MNALKISVLTMALSCFLIGCSSTETSKENKQDTQTTVAEQTPNTTTAKVEEKPVEPKQNIDPSPKAEPASPAKKEEKRPLTDSTPPIKNKNTFTTPVISVVDGDTIKIKINGQIESVRFLLVDTPETHHPRLGKQPFGEEAKAFTKELLEGQNVTLEKDVGERDKYGRLLFYLYVNGKSVQEELLKKGLARVAYIYPPNTKYVDKYTAIQKEAQKKAVGIWSVENYAQEDGFHKEIVSGQSSESTKKATPAQPQKEKPKPTEKPKGSCDIKGNISSSGEKIYHVPGGAFYDKTDITPSKGEKYFCSTQEAETAGWRASLR